MYGVTGPISLHLVQQGWYSAPPRCNFVQELIVSKSINYSNRSLFILRRPRHHDDNRLTVTPNSSQLRTKRVYGIKRVLHPSLLNKPSTGKLL